MFRYAELQAPDDADVIRRVLAIEGSRTATTDINGSPMMRPPPSSPPATAAPGPAAVTTP
jgi:hypothetical protein